MFNNPFAKKAGEVAIDVLSQLFNPKAVPGDEPTAAPAKPKTLDDLSTDDIKREKLRLEQEEKRVLGHIKQVEHEKRQVFAEGAAGGESDRELRIRARKIKELDMQARNMDKTLSVYSKQLRILNGFLQLKENKRLLNDSGISNLISGLDLDTLQGYIDDASLEGEFQLDKFEDILGKLEGSNNLMNNISEDPDVDEIMLAMQQARDAADQPEVIDQQLEQLTNRLSNDMEDFV